MSRLLDALERAEKARDRARGVTRPPSENPPPAAPRAPPPAQGRTPGPTLALGLAVAIFAAVVWAWHGQPFRIPPKGKIDATPLKLDRELKMKSGPSEPPAQGGTTRP